MAISAMIAPLEDYHWEQSAADFEDKSIEDEFNRIMIAGLTLEPSEEG